MLQAFIGSIKAYQVLNSGDHVINLAMLAEGASCSLRGQADPKFKNMTEEEVYAILEKEKLQQNSPVIRSAA